MNRYIIGLSAIMLILIAGCIQTPSGMPGQDGSTGDTNGDGKVECRTVYVEEPYVEEVCAEVTYSEPECVEKELNYTAGPITKTNLCVADGECTGKDIFGEGCLYQCSGAMQRCRMNITNEDPKLAGIWVVGATYSYGGASFVKNPQSVEIEPGETHSFDFEQMYQLGSPPALASCSLYVVHPVVVKDCIEVQKTKIDCENVTKTRIVQEEVCD